MRLRGIRGATVVDQNESDQVVQETTVLLKEMLIKNEVETTEIASILFTATPDVTAEFPAVAARQLGLDAVPLLCATELAVPGSLSLCIRILIHVNTEKSQNEITHVYLKSAIQLRPDRGI